MEGPMSVSSDHPVVKRPIKDPRKTRAAKLSLQGAEWELTDERLDEALRQTFPASDALSIVQNGRGG
jgi:hypothetical protein